MKKLKISILLTIFLFVINPAAFAETKIGFVNFGQLMEQSSQGQAVRKALEREFSSRDKQLAASRDRLVPDSSLLEVKCPYTAREHVITPVTVPYLKDDQGTLTLDRKHDYYFQIQGQLLCTGRSQCYFVVYTFKDLKVITIPRNDTFISDMVQKLLHFYESHFRHALLRNHFYKNYHLYTFNY